MTDIHADSPAEDMTHSADIARLGRRIDRVEDHFLQAFSEIRKDMTADIGSVKAELKADTGKVQLFVDEVKKDVHALNKWKEK